MGARDIDALAAHARGLLEGLGVDVSAPQTLDTPRRWAAALVELTAGLAVDPDRHLAVQFPPECDDPGLIVVPNVAFTALCEHHMLPFTGVATVGYLPKQGAPIVGVSKLARLVVEYAARPQVQERLGHQVVSALERCLSPLGAGCLIRSTHSCMTIRGVRATGSQMVTSHLSGRLRTDDATRAEFMALAR